MNRKMTTLVIGNGEYQGAELKNPKNDANDFAKSIEQFGFSLILQTDINIEEIERTAKSFKDNLNSNDVGVFYFAGHGMQIEGENYLNAINTDFSDEISAKYSSFPLNRLIDIMEKSNNKTNIIILDACRNNPYERAWNRSPALRGLAPVFTPKGTIIAFATSPGETASDGKGRNGAYTDALLRHVKTPDINIEEVFKRTRNTLSATTKGKQTSWEHTSLTGDFIFNISLGRKIDKYSTEAIADELFQIGESKPGHDLVRSLKSHDWYIQNPSINGYNSQALENCDRDTIFVVGRNIYQSACGEARGSNSFINDFRERTSNLSEEKRSAILDGLLFEVFFNSKAELRDSFKISKFNNIFILQKYKEYSASFEFISECLVAYPNRFYVIPGKPTTAHIDIASQINEKGENIIEGVFYGGTDILRKDDQYYFHSEDGSITYSPIRWSAFKDMISEEMIIPLHQLSINCEFDGDGSTRILVPYAYTLNKG